MKTKYTKKTVIITSILLCLIAILFTVFMFNKTTILQTLNIIPTPSITTTDPTITDLTIKDTPAITDITGTYLSISEIGVKITLTDGIRDAVYAPVDINNINSNSSLTKAFGISSQSLIKNSIEGTCRAAGGPLGMILIYNSPKYETNLGTEADLVPNGKTVFEFNGIYYQYYPPQNYGCQSNTISDNEIVDMQQSMQKAIQQDFATLQLDK